MPQAYLILWSSASTQNPLFACDESICSLASARDILADPQPKACCVVLQYDWSLGPVRRGSAYLVYCAMVRSHVPVCRAPVINWPNNLSFYVAGSTSGFPSRSPRRNILILRWNGVSIPGSSMTIFGSFPNKGVCPCTLK